MKKNLLIIFVLLVLGSALCVNGKNINIKRVEPPNWWTNMAESSLQLMISGDEVRDLEVSVDYPGLTIDSVVRPDSPNYLFVYLGIEKDTAPGQIELVFKDGKKSKKIAYELKKRDRQPEEYIGFDTSDVLYLIMPDRFAKGSDSAEKGTEKLRNKAPLDRSRPNGRHGGDISGIRKHLGYIDSLGVTAVWLNPVLTNDIKGGSYHGYATTDYYSIDPRFGSNEEWKAFVEECHSKGIKVVMDMIFNHIGIGHPWMEDKPMKDWINFPEKYVQTNHRLSTVYDPYASDYDKKRAVDGWFVPGMPDLNQRNPHLMKYLIQNSIWWIEESKINGIRMDTHPYADVEGMAQWLKTVKKEYPNFNIVGECWYGNEGSSAWWQKDSYVNRGTNTELETVMDFVLCMNARDAFNNNTKDRDGLNKIYEHLALDVLFPNKNKILTFLDNHDTDRFLEKLPENLDRWKQAQIFLLTSRGIPQIYYGTEILMNGTRANGGDGMIRLDMPGGFPGDTVSVFQEKGRTKLQNEAFGFLSKMLHYRRGNRVISDGSLKHFVPESGVYTYERKLGSDRLVVIMNGTDEEVEKDMEQTIEILPFGSQYRDVLTGEIFVVSARMIFKPRAVYVLEPVED